MFNLRSNWFVFLIVLTSIFLGGVNANAQQQVVEGSVFTFWDHEGSYLDMVPSGSGKYSFLMFKNGTDRCVGADWHLTKLIMVDCIDGDDTHNGYPVRKEWRLPRLVDSRGQSYVKFQIEGVINDQAHCMGLSDVFVPCSFKNNIIKIKLPKKETFRIPVSDRQRPGTFKF